MNCVEPIRNKELILDIGDYLKDQCERDYVLFMTGIYLGRRIGDMLQMKVRDVRDRDYIYIKEQKTSKFRLVVYNSDAQKAIAFFLKATGINPSPDEYVFASQKNGHMTRKGFCVILQKAAESCGIKHAVGTHSLRKTFGYRYYKASGDITVLQQIFGHSTPLITLRYIGITTETIQNAYESITGTLVDNLEEYL